ncbi:MAG: Fe-S cluster assembly sulfur transfer protein SufU [Pseudomonadota bacterium]
MDDLRELYQEVIFDHYRKPRNFRHMDDANRQAQGYNPLCGDKVTVLLRLEDGLIRDASFEGAGCAISIASASLMTDILKGKSEAEALRLMDDFHGMVTGVAASAADVGKLRALAGVREFPQRVKCATLAWHTLRAALENSQETVTTE